MTGTIISKRPDGDTTIKTGFTFEPYNPNEWSFLKPKDKVEKIRWRKESIERYIKSNEEKLKRGGTLYGSFGTYKEYALRINRIMSDSTLNLFTKVDELKKIEPAAGFYKQIIYNYSQEEYQDIEKRNKNK